MSENDRPRDCSCRPNKKRKRRRNIIFCCFVGKKSSRLDVVLFDDSAIICYRRLMPRCLENWSGKLRLTLDEEWDLVTVPPPPPHQSRVGPIHLIAPPSECNRAVSRDSIVWLAKDMMDILRFFFFFSSSFFIFFFVTFCHLPSHSLRLPHHYGYWLSVFTSGKILKPVLRLKNKHFWRKKYNSLFEVNFFFVDSYFDIDINE